jgi:hypothetical protein
VEREIDAAVDAVEMWESGAFCRISKRGGKLAFGVFHRASFPPRRSWHIPSISVRTERSDENAPRRRCSGRSLRSSVCSWTTLPTEAADCEPRLSSGRRISGPPRGSKKIALRRPQVHFSELPHSSGHGFFRCGHRCVRSQSDSGQDPFPSFPLSSWRADLPCSSIW